MELNVSSHFYSLVKEELNVIYILDPHQTMSATRGNDNDLKINFDWNKIQKAIKGNLQPTNIKSKTSGFTPIELYNQFSKLVTLYLEKADDQEPFLDK